MYEIEKNVGAGWMGMIRLLDEKTINKIAAGEVVEKPASIVKELVENSIDAGADEITVEVKGGGISYIRVSDNGKGIPGNELEYAFLRHATSKISTFTDLNRIVTLGFRGEALASVAAVSKVEMVSKAKDAESGYMISIEGGRILKKEQCGSPEGTVITVKDVFYNTPARLKFLKSESREGMYITEVMENLAMSHTKISFKYRLNDKIVFATKGDGDLKSVLFGIYGREIANNIIEVNCTRDFISIKGFIGNSSIAKGSRSSQSVFINGRYIKNKTITAAVESAYKSMLTINKFPFFVLEIIVNPEFVDVNVHPAKSEVKFQDDGIIFKAVYHCVKDALLSFSSITEIDYKKKSILDNLPKINYTQQEIQLDTAFEHNKISENKDIFYEEKNKPEEFFDNRFKQKNSEIQNKEKDKEIGIKNTNRVPKFGPLSVVGQIHFTYIIAEGPDDMYIIDQHAAHERIYYEKYFEEFKNTGIHSQNLIVPVVLNLSLSEKQLVLDNIDFFKQFGYEIDDFGGSAVSLRTVPVIYGNPDPKDIFAEIISQFNSKEDSTINVIDRVIYTMACKSAVKAGDKLNYREMAELVQNLRFCENPYTCPHGRPTIVKMTVYELEKKFKRIQ